MSRVCSPTGAAASLPKGATAATAQDFRREQYVAIPAGDGGLTGAAMLRARMGQELSRTVGDNGAAPDSRLSSGWLIIWPPQRGHVSKSRPVNARRRSFHVGCGGLAAADWSLTSRWRRASTSFV